MLKKNKIKKKYNQLINYLMLENLIFCIYIDLTIVIIESYMQLERQKSILE